MTVPSAFVIFKALIGFGLPLLFAWRELVLVNRAIARRKAAEAASGGAEIGDHVELDEQVRVAHHARDGRP
jgi:hypothetical protein